MKLHAKTQRLKKYIVGKDKEMVLRSLVEKGYRRKKYNKYCQKKKRVLEEETKKHS